LAHRIALAPGAAIEISAGSVLTLSATPEAQATERIFSGHGTVAILAADRPVFGEWWGAKPDSRTDSAPAFQAAANAIAGGGTIEALAGSYRFGCDANDAVTVHGHGAVNIHGMGEQVTFFRPATNCSHFLFVVDPTGQSGNLRDFAIFGDQLSVAPPSVAFGGIECLRCGVMDVSNIYLANVGRGIVFTSLADALVHNVTIKSCASTCLTLGGSNLNANGAEHVCLDTFSDIWLTPLAGQIGMLVDSGVCEVKFQRLIEAGAAHQHPPGAAAGIVVQNQSANGHRPEELRFYDANIDDNAAAGLDAKIAWLIEIHGSTFGTTSQGPSISIGSAKARNDVDGFWIDSSTIRGGAQDGILVRSGCNLRITNDVVDANGLAADNRYAGIRIGTNACGLVEITNSMIGLDSATNGGWGNVRGKQAFAVVLEPYALSDWRAPNGLFYSGHLMMTGNVMAGNTQRPYMDNSAPDRTRKLIQNNLEN
jgi:hypothetical protein